jgi:hypothetical protein
MMSNARAIRYRRLALVEQDNEKARLLLLIADEADRGILSTAAWTSRRYDGMTDLPPPKPRLTISGIARSADAR